MRLDTARVESVGRAMSAWRYERSADAFGYRDLRLDLLRGFCIFVMTVDHVGGESSWLYAVTGGNRLVVSAAEVFVLISGLVMGMVYRGVILRGGAAAMLGKVLGRAWLLYVVTVVLTVVFAAVSILLGTPWAGRATPASSTGEFVITVLAFQRTYTLTDVLVLYTLLVVAAGPALWLIARGHTLFVFVLSWMAWSLQQLWPEWSPRAWEIVDGGFPFSAWQVLFFMGLLLGFHRARLARFFTPPRLVVFAVAIAVALTLVQALAALAAAGQLAAMPDISGLLFDKTNNRIGRVLAVFAFVAASYALVTLLWTPVRRHAGWLLLTIGRRPLFAFGVHIFVVAFMSSEFMAPVRFDRQNEPFQIAAVLVVWLACLRAPQAAAEVLRSLANTSGVAVRAGIQIASVVVAPAMAIALIATLTGGVFPSVRDSARTSVSDEQAMTVAQMQHGRLEERSFHSAALARTVPVTVYVPPDYDADPSAQFAVLYMLHGRGGSNREWIDYGLIDTADALMAGGAIAPLLIVLPQSDQPYWVDHLSDAAAGVQGDWGTYVAHDLVTQVDEWYRTLAKPEGRAVGGLSVGGHAAIQLSMNFDNVWSALGAHSPSLPSAADPSAHFGSASELAARDPLSLVLEKPSLAGQYKWWIDVGDADPWRDAVIALHEALNDLQIVHEWNVYSGDHSADYWSARVSDYLTYYSNALCGATTICR
jgi:enterochelin esterase-like enzyme